MKKEELKQVYAYASLLWQTFKVPTEEDKLILQSQIWYDFLKDYDLETIFASMRELCKESDFCNIGKIAKGCQTIYGLVEKRLDEEDVFNEITKAVSYYNCDENFYKLSEIAKKVVVEPSQLARWALCETETYNTVVASNIKKSIRNQIQKQDKIESVGIKVLENIKNNQALDFENERKLLNEVEE